MIYGSGNGENTSETSVNFCCASGRNVQEDSHLHTRRRESGISLKECRVSVLRMPILNSFLSADCNTVQATKSVTPVMPLVLFYTKLFKFSWVYK
jgi:hypothetical protein